MGQEQCEYIATPYRPIDMHLMHRDGLISPIPWLYHLPGSAPAPALALAPTRLRLQLQRPQELPYQPQLPALLWIGLIMSPDWERVHL